MPTTLITGTNKGISLQLAAQLKARGQDVIAMCRGQSPELSALAIRIIDGIEVTDPTDVKRLNSEFAGQKIDVLINNAGIMQSDSFGSLDYEVMVEQYRVNALGPLRVTEALVDYLSEGSKVVISTSREGSITDNQSGGYYGYRASKAAVNQMGVNLGHELKKRGIAVALLHPGMIATELTGGRGISTVG